MTLQKKIKSRFWILKKTYSRTMAQGSESKAIHVDRLSTHYHRSLC